MKFDFTQNRSVEDINAVPENFRSFYMEVEEGDKSIHKIRDDEPAVVAAINTITGLNTALVAARQDVDSAKKNTVDLSPLKDYGENPQAIAETFGKKVKALEERAGQDVKSQVDAIRQELAQAHAAAASKTAKTIQSLETQLDDHMVNNAIAGACPHVNGADPALVAPFARRRLKIDIDPETGARSLIPLNREGGVMYSTDPNHAGEKASTVELLRDMAGEPGFAPLFPSAQRQGSGAADSAGIPKSPKMDVDKMTPSQKISEGLKDLK